MKEEGRGSRTFAAQTTVHTRRFGEELILLELSLGEYFSLDGIGSRVWEELIGGRTLEEVVAGLEADYDVAGERLRADIDALVEQLIQKGLLMARGPDRAAV